MGLHTKIYSSFWSDQDASRLGKDEKLACLWLMTNRDTNNIGFVKVSERQFEFDTGCPLKALEGALKGLPRGFVFEEKSGGLSVLILGYVHHQFGPGPVAPSNRIYKHLQGLARGLSETLREAFLERYPEFGSPLHAPSHVLSPLHAPSSPIQGTSTAQHSTAQNRVPEGGGGGTETGKPHGSPLDGASGEFHVERSDGIEGTAREGELRYDLARGVLEFLNKKTGAAFLPTPEALYPIASRLLDAAQDVAGVQRMIERQVGLWGQDGKMHTFLRPGTLFGDKFHEYYGQRDVPMAADRGARRAELRGLIERSRANRESTYHSQEATEADRASLKGWRRELAALER